MYFLNESSAIYSVISIMRSNWVSISTLKYRTKRSDFESFSQRISIFSFKILNQLGFRCSTTNITEIEFTIFYSDWTTVSKVYSSIDHTHLPFTNWLKKMEIKILSKILFSCSFDTWIIFFVSFINFLRFKICTDIFMFVWINFTRFRREWINFRNLTKIIFLKTNLFQFFKKKTIFNQNHLKKFFLISQIKQ